MTTESSGAGVGGVGLLQGFRRKIGRYGSTSALAAPPFQFDTPLANVVEIQETCDGPSMACARAVRGFREQDQLLRRLDGELTGMLQQLQLSCTSMLQVARLFAETLRSDEEAYQLSVEFLESMHRVVRDGVEVTEQSIRFTVADPLQARLHRHAQLESRLADYDRLVRDVRSAQESVAQLQAARPETDERRCKAEAKLEALRIELEAMQHKIAPAIDELTHGCGFTSQSDLFAAMRLQLATFFFNANKALFPGLSATEMEIVTGASYSDATRRPMTMVSQPISGERQKVLSNASDEWSEVDASLIPDDGDARSTLLTEDDEVSRPSITLEEFEMGCSPPNMNNVVSSRDADRLDTRSPVASSKSTINEELKALAAHPMVPADFNDTVHDEPAAVVSPHGSRSLKSPFSDTSSVLQRQTSGVLTSLGKSIRGRLGYSDSQASLPRSPSVDSDFLVVTASATTSPTHSPPRSRSSRPIGLSSEEWRAIEACLWDIDVRKRLESTGSASKSDLVCATGDDSLSRLLQEDEALFHTWASFLQLEDLARLSMVNRVVHHRLLDCPPLWKQCIRASGLRRPIRSTVWLSAFYESTPWRFDGIAPHRLSRDTRKRMYEQLLLKVGTKLAHATMKQSATSEEDMQLLAWMHEIDIDVARTCTKDISVDHEEDHWGMHRFVSTSSSSASSRTNSNGSAFHSVSSSDDSTTDTASVADVDKDDDVAAYNAATTPDGQAATRRADVEAKIRRVLRAYVMYNPRVGYCQGMNFLVRLLTEVADEEADIFWLFVGFSEPENDRNLYEPGLAVLQPFLSKYEVLFSNHMPELHAHFQAEGVHAAAFCARWFLTLFSSFETLSPSLVLRLFDVFVVDGWRIIFSMALVVLDELRTPLMAADLEGILRILQSPREYMELQTPTKCRQLLRHALAFSISQMINSV